jgi:citrate lyase beta subunit
MITSYQFVKFKEETFVDFHRQLSEQNTVSCFDFEDSIIDFKKNDTNRYKSDYREKVIKLVTKNKTKILKSWIGFRINEYGDNRYFDDIAALNKLDGMKFKALFLANVSSAEILEQFINDNPNLNFDEVIPIIESNESFSGLEGIMKFKHPKFKNVAFGHCDYNLNCNIFPFIHQDNARYWFWVQKFQKLCLENNIGFINSIYLNLNHSSHFKLMLKNTSRFFDNWGQVTLNTQQSTDAHNFNDADLINVRELNLLEDMNITEYADKIVKLFEKYNPEGRGYTIMPDTKIFICPQEYLAAKRFISE